MKARTWLLVGLLIGAVLGLPVIRAQVGPGAPRFPGILSIASGKTVTFDHTSTFTTTDAQSYTFPTTSATVARTDAAQSFAGTQTFSGVLVASTGSASNPSVTFSGDTNTGFYSNGASSSIINITSSGTRFALLTANLFGLAHGTTLQWYTAGFGGVSVQLSDGDAAGNVLSQRNATNPQTFYIYNTFTNPATAGEWWKADWRGTSNQFRMGAVAGSSSGTNRAASWDYGDKLASATAAITVPATSGNIVFGGGLTIPGGATLLTTNTALTDGAAASLGTLSNAPAAGNPTKWIAINDNGTTRYIPAW